MPAPPFLSLNSQTLSCSLRFPAAPPRFPPPPLQNVEYLEGYGSFLAEVGPRSEALAVLQKAAQLLPDEGFEKYM